MTEQMLFKKLKDLKEAVKNARGPAEDEARRYPWSRSRGTMIGTTGFDDSQCAPCPGGEAVPWNGTLREITETIEEVRKSYPAVRCVYVFGGYDGADTFDQLYGGDYEPWVSNWEVEVWTRDKAAAVA